MLNRKRNYLRILDLELEDLKEDLQCMIEECTRRWQEGQLTNYVHRENVATFKSEMIGLDTFRRIVEETDPEEFPDLESMAEYLKKRFHRYICAAGIPEAVNICIDRKLNKVARYVTQQSALTPPRSV